MKATCKHVLSTSDRPAHKVAGSTFAAVTALAAPASTVIVVAAASASGLLDTAVTAPYLVLQQRRIHDLQAHFRQQLIASYVPFQQFGTT